MTYLALNVVFLFVAIAVAGVAATPAFRPPSATSRRRIIGASAVAVLVALALTAVFDNIMIAVGLFAYEPEHIAGLMIGLAPIEDFFYPVAAAILLPAVWVLTARRVAAARVSER